MTVDEYYEKRKKAQLEEAQMLVREYRKRYGRDPGADDLSEFFFLFTNENHTEIESFQRQMNNLGNYDITCERLANNDPIYPSMQAFLDDVN